MITIKDYLDFWAKDLVKIKLSSQVSVHLTSATNSFITQYGLPSINRIYSERKTFLEQTTFLPQIVLSKKNIEDSIRRQFPYFEFETSLSSTFVFQGQEFIRLGVEDDRVIAIEARSGNVHCIDLSPPLNPWPVDLPPIAQNLFVNGDIEKLGLCLTAEFLAKQKSISPRKKLVKAYESKNTELRLEAEKEVNQIINDLENELKTIDYLAFETTDSYWVYYFLNARYPG